MSTYSHRISFLDGLTAGVQAFAANPLRRGIFIWLDYGNAKVFRIGSSETECIEILVDATETQLIGMNSIGSLITAAITFVGPADGFPLVLTEIFEVP